MDSMAVVPWKYSNPFVNRKSMPVQQFTFAGKSIEISQDIHANIDVHHNTGRRLWDGAFLLSKHIETNYHELWKGKRCIELGCGCGLVGTVAWLLGANVTLTDTEDTLVHTVQGLNKNFEKWEAQGCAIPPKEALNVEALLWGRDKCRKYGDTTFDVILGSDIIYQPEATTPLLETLDELCSDKTLILIAYKPRGLGENIFFQQLVSFSLEYVTVPKCTYPEDFCNSDYVIFKIQRKIKKP